MRNQTCDLNSCFLCTHCIPEWKEAIAVNKKTIHFKRGEQIIKEGEKVNGIYFINSGSAKVHKHWGVGKELIIRFATPGDIVGYRGFGLGDPYPISATALEDCKACFVTNNFLEATLKTNHAFTYTLMQFFSAELQKAETRMRNLALMEVKGRIAEALLELLSVFGTNKEKYISMPITRQDIASYAGTTYETVFKFLKILIKAKTISATGKSIKINDENKLRKIVQTAR